VAADSVTIVDEWFRAGGCCLRAPRYVVV